jgi:hypothetical protein
MMGMERTIPMIMKVDKDTGKCKKFTGEVDSNISISG